MTEIRLEPRRIVRWLGAATLIVIAAGVSVQWLKYRYGHGNIFGLFELLDLDREANLPSWFESALFLFAAALLCLIGRAKSAVRDPWTAHWTSLGFIFIVLSLDEIAAIHERTIVPMREFLRIEGGFFYFAWMILGIVFVLVLGVFYLRFVMGLPARLKCDAVIAGALFLGGVFVAEGFGGRYMALYGQDNLEFNMLCAVEEALEMIGLWYWIRTLFHMLCDMSPAGELTLKLK